MEFDLGNISSMYHDEESDQLRKLIVRPDGDLLYFDIKSEAKDHSCIIFDKKQVELLCDTLKLILKNKLIEEEIEG